MESNHLEVVQKSTSTENKNRKLFLIFEYYMSSIFKTIVLGAQNSYKQGQIKGSPRPLGLLVKGTRRNKKIYYFSCPVYY